MSVFVEIILVYLLYRFIAGFLIPLFRTTNSMRQQFRDMNSQPPSGSASQSQNSPAGSDAHSNTPKSNAPKAGEYIDFEEIN